LAFGSAGAPIASTYKIAPATNKLRKKTCTVEATMKLWTMVPLTLSRTQGTVQLWEHRRMTSWFRRWPI
jgi:hypothetical protein